MKAARRHGHSACNSSAALHSHNHHITIPCSSLVVDGNLRRSVDRHGEARAHCPVCGARCGGSAGACRRGRAAIRVLSAFWTAAERAGSNARAAATPPPLPALTLNLEPPCAPHPACRPARRLPVMEVPARLPPLAPPATRLRSAARCSSRRLSSSMPPYSSRKPLMGLQFWAGLQNQGMCISCLLLSRLPCPAAAPNRLPLQQPRPAPRPAPRPPRPPPVPPRRPRRRQVSRWQRPGEITVLLQQEGCLPPWQPHKAPRVPRHAHASRCLQPPKAPAPLRATWISREATSSRRPAKPAPTPRRAAGARSSLRQGGKLGGHCCMWAVRACGGTPGSAPPGVLLASAACFDCKLVALVVCRRAAPTTSAACPPISRCHSQGLMGRGGLARLDVGRSPAEAPLPKCPHACAPPPPHQGLLGRGRMRRLDLGAERRRKQVLLEDRSGVDAPAVRRAGVWHRAQGPLMWRRRTAPPRGGMQSCAATACSIKPPFAARFELSPPRFAPPAQAALHRAPSSHDVHACMHLAWTCVLHRSQLCLSTPPPATWPL